MESLLANPEQLNLISEEDIEADLRPVYAELEKRGHFTAERLFKQRPEAYRMIVALTGHGMGQNMIAESLKVSNNTVRCVELREKDSIDTLKKKTSAKALMVSRMCLDAMTERLDDPEQRKKIPFKDLAIAAGVTATKHMELNGDVVPTLDGENFKAGAEAFAGFLTAMGSVVEKSGQKGEPAADQPAADQAADPVERAKPVIDLEAAQDSGAPDLETDAYGSKT